MKSDESHFRNLERALFAPGGLGVPEWLAFSAGSCQDRYADIRLTEQFKAAIQSFDDGGSPKPFELFVVGEGKFGKSTIVNCLLGEEQSKVRGLPETRCFLRYVVSEQPGEKARLYLRTKRGIHDWIHERVGRGTPVKELYEILEHTVNLRTAQEILDGEIGRLDKGLYEPAIYEIEREIGRTKHTAFNGPVRIVDTQGLDQLFPDEVKKETQGMDDDTSAERFIKWLNNSPRGKHLEWQFRRCDAVLWCVSAKRIGSAATIASLRHFAGYSKKIVIALTNVDTARNERDKLRLLEAAEKKYGLYSNKIVPINGLAAWEGISKDDEELISESGLNELVKVLSDVCEVEGIKVRNLARYLGLRHTEGQFRMALRALSDDYSKLQKKYDSDRKRIIASLEKDWKAISGSIIERANIIGRNIRGRVTTVEFRDDRSQVDGKLDHRTEVARLSSFIKSEIDRVVLSNMEAEIRLTSEYQLPTFDAEGNRAGSSISISMEPRASSVSLDIPSFGFFLGDWFDNATDWMDEKFGRLVGGKAASDQRRAQRLQERRSHIDDVLSADWKSHVERTLNEVKKESIRQYQALLDAIDAVYARIEQHAGGSVKDSDQRIKVALEELAVPPVFQSQMLAALIGVRTGKSANVKLKKSVKALPVTFPVEELLLPKSSHPLKAKRSRDRLEAGARVAHINLGQGVISKIVGGTYTVQFDRDRSIRKFDKVVMMDPVWFL